MKLDFNQEDLTSLTQALAPALAKELRPLLQAKATGDQVFGVKELALYLGQKPSWIYAHIEEIPHVKKGGLLMFKKSLIDKWLEPAYCPTVLDSMGLDRRGGYEKG